MLLLLLTSPPPPPSVAVGVDVDVIMHCWQPSCRVMVSASASRRRISAYRTLASCGEGMVVVCDFVVVVVAER